MHATKRAHVDVSDRDAVFAFVQRERPTLILNGTGYTAVDKAESEPALARAGNADAPAFLDAAGKSVGARVLHVSTDYVFDGTGTRPLREDDATGPVSAYGKSKREGEERSLAATDATGVVHVADEAGPRGISWHDFAVAIRAGALARGLPVKAKTVEAIPTSAYPTPAVRPAWSVLDCSRCEQLTGPLPAWHQTLDTYLATQRRHRVSTSC